MSRTYLDSTPGDGLQRFEPVRRRLRTFHARYPLGSIRTELVRLQEGRVVVRASAYRDGDDPRPATGWAHALGAAGDAFVERCEVCAVGRALANLGFARGPRPSREEVLQARETARVLDEVR